VSDIIITTGPLGGCGDHSVYSTLPERFSALGHDVYVDADNIARNEEIIDLWWAKNPFVKGTSDKKPNAGYVNQGKYYDTAGKFPIGSIEAMERAHGLPPPYLLAPKIYYEPQPYVIDLKDAVLVDFSAVSSSMSGQGIMDALDKMTERWPGRTFYKLTFPEGIIRNVPPIDGPSIRMNSIYEYVDALASCHAWVGSEAGGQALAAAVRGEHDVYDLEARPELVAVLSPKTFNSRGYTFRGVDYRVTTTSGYAGDYWTPAEVPYERYHMMCRKTVEEARDAWAAAKLAREAKDRGEL
jgi:hypothetical protein